MEVHPGDWSGFGNHTQPHAFMASTSDGQSTLSPQVLHGRLSLSHESQWEKIYNEFDNGGNDLTTGLDLLNPSATTSIRLQDTPMRSVESVTAADSKQVLAAHVAGIPSSTLLPMNYAQQHRFWHGEDTAAQINGNTLSARGQWFMPQSHNQTMVPQQLMNFEDAGLQSPHQAQFSSARPNPFVHEASPQLCFDDGMNDCWDQVDKGALFTDGSGSDESNDVDADAADPCYAQLLYRCLKEAHGHTMSLKDLYEWIKEHSQKAKDQKNRGWQNSVRHNLSMNAVSNSPSHLAPS